MIVDRSELGEIRKGYEGETIAFRFGCYDILHADHLKGIRRAAAYASRLVIGVMSDEYMTKTKGSDRPYVAEDIRARQVYEAEEVDGVFIAPAGRLALAKAVLELSPDVYVEGAEYGANPWKGAFLVANGICPVVDDRAHDMSSTDIVARLGRDAALELSSFTFNPHTVELDPAVSV